MKKAALSLITLAFLVVALALIPEQALAQDPTEVDPEHYTVIFENEEVRVLRIHYGAEEGSVMHFHPNSVVVFLTDSIGQFTLPDGTVVESSGNAGDVVWAPAGLHDPKNISDTKEINVIVVELKTHDEDGG